jgi:hypothetical protein
MRTDQRTAAMQKYFTAYPAKYPTFSLILKVGLGLVVFGAFIMFFLNNTIITGIILILSGFALTYYWLKPYLRDKKLYEERPVADDMYKWLINDLHTKIKERASDTLRLNIASLKPQNFMILPYPVYWPEPGIKDEFILKRDTEEEKVIYSIWKAQVIALTQNYISYYNCTYDWLNDVIYNERTNEFFYDDISSVKNDVEQMAKTFIGDEEAKTLNTFVFKVTNMSSDNLTVITKIPELNYSPKVEVSLEKAVQALRIILRKRRYQEDQDPIYIDPEINKQDDDK